jgi:hypothetical protein
VQGRAGRQLEVARLFRFWVQNARNLASGPTVILRTDSLR